MKALLLSVLAVASLATTASAEHRPVRELTGSYPTAAMRRIELKLAPGEISIVPSPDRRLRVELQIACDFDESNCRERADRVSIDTETSGNTLTLRVEGMPTMNLRGLSVHGRILVPREVTLEVDLPAGELKIRGIEGDLEVDVGAGEVKLDLRERDVRSVRVSVGIGEASLSVAGRSIEGRSWLGNRVRWGEGTGPARVSVDVGVGEVEVKLD